MVTSNCSLGSDQKEGDNTPADWFRNLQEKQKLRREFKVPESLDELQHYLGNRIILEDSSTAKGLLFGTVRYVGPVVTSKKAGTQWVGIEWDTEERGKHSGEVKLEDGSIHEYFQCKPNHGSFLRPKKITWPQDLLTIILTTWNVNDINDVMKEQDEIAQSSNYRYEFVGWEKQTKRKYDLSRMECICLSHKSVGWVDRAAELRSLCPVLVELNLSFSTIQSFRSLPLLDEAFPNLKSLDISHNIFNDMPEPHAFERKFTKVQELKLANIQTGFSALMVLAKVGCFLNLRNILLTHCDIVEWQGRNEKDTDIAGLFPLLEIVTIGNSGLIWENVIPFRKCRNLKTLNLQFNPIIEINCEKGDFPALENLSLTHTKLPLNNLYGAISLAKALTNFEKLIGIEIAKTPLDTDPMCKHILLSECPQLVTINRSRFRRRERLDCNMEYIKWCTIETAKKYPNLLEHSDGENLLLQRIFEVFPQAKWVAPAEGISVKYYLKNKKSEAADGVISTIGVKLISLDEKSCTKPAKRKRVPVSMKVGTLKTLFKRHFKRPVEEQVLAFRKPGMDIPLRLEDENKTLEDYRMFDGAEILMYNKTTF